MSAQPFSMVSGGEVVGVDRPSAHWCAHHHGHAPAVGLLGHGELHGELADAGVEVLCYIVQLFQAVIIVRGNGDAG